MPVAKFLLKVERSSHWVSIVLPVARVQAKRVLTRRLVSQDMTGGLLRTAGEGTEAGDGVGELEGEGVARGEGDGLGSLVTTESEAMRYSLFEPYLPLSVS